jgi:hypothetical protein
MESVDALCWTGPAPSFAGLCAGVLDAPNMAERAERLAATR